MFCSMLQMNASVHNGKVRNLNLKVVKGVADLCLSVSRHGFNALYIEMKKPGNYQSKEQKEWQSGVEKHGNKYVVCKSLDEFEKLITDYLRE